MPEDNTTQKINAAFAEVESRVKGLVAENRELKERMRMLEEELARARHSARDLEHLNSRRLHIREKVERVLQSLEALKEQSPERLPRSEGNRDQN